MSLKRERKRVGYDPRTSPSLDEPRPSKSELPWALKKSPEPPAFSDLPLIFSGPHSNQLWNAVNDLGSDSMTAKEVHDAIYQLACSMQALEARLTTAFKQLQKPQSKKSK